MNELGELYREATETSRPAPAQEVTRRIRRRLHRRRAGRVGAGAVAALALVAGGYAWHGGDPAPPPQLRSAATLPADQPVGRGTQVTPRPGSGDALLATVRHKTYVVPGRIGRTAALLGTPLSPTGRWLATNADGGMQVRDLTGHTTYRTHKAGRAGFPVAWSADERWLVLRGAPDGNQVDDTLYRLDLRNGTVRTVTIGAHRSGDELAAILPDGDPVFEVPGSKPEPAPTREQQARLGTGNYQVVDPATGKAMRTYSVPDAQVWRAQDVAPFDPEGTHTPRLDWRPGVRAALIVSPDAQTGVAVTRVYGKDPALRLGVLDLGSGTSQPVNLVIKGDPDTAAVREWLPTRLDSDRLTLLGRTGRNAYTARLTVDLSHGRTAAVEKIHYPEGSLPAGVLSTAH